MKKKKGWATGHSTRFAFHNDDEAKNSFTNHRAKNCWLPTQRYLLE
jgi:hypothetical protein